jgi:hypothetical protein
MLQNAVKASPKAWLADSKKKTGAKPDREDVTELRAVAGVLNSGTTNLTATSKSAGALRRWVFRVTMILLV